ncbi:MAG: M23 family metallopeptidase [Candidatus Korobacteraceae bacterium]
MQSNVKNNAKQRTSGKLVGGITGREHLCLSPLFPIFRRRRYLFRRLLLGAVALVCSIPPPTLAAQGHGATVSAAPGTLIRWEVPGAKRCSMKGRSWAALEGTCYYPVDLLQKPALITIALWGSGHREFARISVEPYEYGTEEIDLPDIPQAHPSPEDLKRDSRDQALLSKVWKRKEGLAEFTLPLGAPARPLPAGKSFGVKRVFNGKPASQPHTGSDYATPVGTPVLAVADGTVVVAEDLFFEGNAVFIDHGDGLVSMCFHLSEIKVQAGQEVKKGQTLGRVGSTGRATGPHLFFGVRWHNARINPQFLLEDPGKIPAVNRVSP